jgi:hypothetical protein
MSVEMLTARVTQLQALNRSYLAALRDTEESYKPYDELVAHLQKRVRELEACVAEQPAPPAADTVLGCSTAQFLKGMEIIMRDTGKAFPEAFALWRTHAAECEEERQAERSANASRDGLRAYLGEWLSAGSQKKAICACSEWDCPTRDLCYVVGRGFVDRRDEEGRAFAAAQEDLSRFCAEANAEFLAGAADRGSLRKVVRQKWEGEDRGSVCATVGRRPMTWAERVLAGTK